MGGFCLCVCLSFSSTPSPVYSFHHHPHILLLHFRFHFLPLHVHVHFHPRFHHLPLPHLHPFSAFSTPINILPRTDLYFYYGSAFGNPLSRVQGVGYLIELLARLTKTPIERHWTSTNSTLTDDGRIFPLDQSLYVDATHEVVILNGELSFPPLLSPSTLTS